VTRAKYQTIAVVILAVTIVVIALAWLHTRSGSTANGTGLNYQGSFYWASGVEVRSDALGRPVAESVPFQDTTASLREIKGLDPQTSLAAWLPMISSAVPHPAWIFISTDEARGTNPRAFPDIAPVLASQ
jgi:hypothetical protein